jgi:PPOX class probable F420-dependent enzyme
MDGPRPSILNALEREPVVWLSTTRPDGWPHVVPLWFLWDGRSIVAFSKPHAQKVRNLRADPRVVVAVGRADANFDVELIEAVAELHDAPPLLPEEFVRKYASRAAEAGI